MLYVNVAIDVPLHKTFTYTVPEEMSDRIAPGMRVVVPFRKRERMGYVIEIDVTPPNIANLKEVSDLPDEEPILSERLLSLLQWMAGYYAAPIGEVCAAAVPNILNRADEIGKKRQTPKEITNLESFQKERTESLTESQETIWKSWETILKKETFDVALLHGITGSGKTELYLKLMEKVVSDGKTAILLVPEISLTPQLAGRVMVHFPERVAIYHSGITDVQRLHQWEAIQRGDIDIVVGTRSAMFAPLKNLGAIIIDEEHDHSYKQEESPRYHARDSAIMRAKLEGAFVVLGSATPSIESLANAKSDKYHYYHLQERYGDAVLPDVRVIDMRKEPRSELLNPHLSIELISAIDKRLKKNQQTLLFLNRRGYANFFLCQDCGHTPECPNCKITLTYHKKGRQLTCHYCDYSIPGFDSCPKCHGIDILLIGSGTELIEEAIGKRFPSAHIARLDRDTVTSEKKRRELLSDMHRGKIDILIGTQMITKGHDFPNVTLVGIISADQSIHFPDFRSSERTVQLITQVSGRAGRAKDPGEVIIQTYDPEHISIATASKNELDRYIESELNVRKELSYPPFSRIANIRIVGNRPADVKNTSEQLMKGLNQLAGGNHGVRLLGPAPAPIAMMRGKTRWQILIKSPSAGELARILNQLMNHLEENPIRGIQVSIDVDPVSVM